MVLRQGAYPEYDAACEAVAAAQEGLDAAFGQLQQALLAQGAPQQQVGGWSLGLRWVFDSTFLLLGWGMPANSTSSCCSWSHPGVQASAARRGTGPGQVPRGPAGGAGKGESGQVKLGPLPWGVRVHGCWTWRYHTGSMGPLGKELISDSMGGASSLLRTCLCDNTGT